MKLPEPIWHVSLSVSVKQKRRKRKRRRKGRRKEKRKRRRWRRRKRRAKTRRSRPKKMAVGNAKSARGNQKVRFCIKGKEDPLPTLWAQKEEPALSA